MTMMHQKLVIVLAFVLPNHMTCMNQKLATVLACAVPNQMTRDVNHKLVIVLAIAVTWVD